MERCNTDRNTRRDRGTRRDRSPERDRGARRNLDIANSIEILQEFCKNTQGRSRIDDMGKIYYALGVAFEYDLPFAELAEDYVEKYVLALEQDDFLKKELEELKIVLK